MTSLVAIALLSLKACLLLAAAGGLTLVLRRRPARLRAVVWATALVGAALIPALGALVPVLPIPLPVAVPALTGSTTQTPDTLPGVSASESEPILGEGRTQALATTGSTADPGGRWRGVERAALVIWAVGALLLLARQALGLVSMRRIVRRARPISDPGWRTQLAVAAEQVGCRRGVGLVTTSELDVPAVFGVLRPVVILPGHADAWLDDRRAAVLQHELIHVVRLDWPVRVASRLAAAVHWFNPLVWWAVRRLDLEQELACDEEVLSLGSRASTYACHLLSIARAAVPRPAVAAAGLAMARRCHLEERVMSILSHRSHRRVGLGLILSAVVVTAALVPAIAAVTPTEPQPRTASPELASVVAEIEATEQSFEPELERIREIEREMRPSIKALEDIEVEIDHEAIARIQAEMQPILEQIQAVEIDMAPVQVELEAIAERMREVKLHIEDGTLDEVQAQIHEQLQAVTRDLESIHLDMEPYAKQLQELHKQLEPMHSKIAQLTEVQAAKIREQVERSREITEREREKISRLEAEMERAHRNLEPVHERMERLHDRLEAAVRNDVAVVLRSHLGSVTSPAAPFDEAAARLLDHANTHLGNGLIEVDISRREAQEILTGLLLPVRIGTQEGFDAALETAVNEVCHLVIRAD